MSDTDSDTPIEPINNYHDLQTVLGPTGKRLDYITWNQHHMFMARSIGEMSRSGDEGCYIVDGEHYQIASGYSGEILSNDVFCGHAISVALHRMQSESRKGEECVMYITKPPDCHQCVDRILEANIFRILYWTEAKEVSDDVKRRLFRTICEKYHPTRQISIEFDNLTVS